ncbi:MAG: urate hydroxylase PuuD [Actinobacteria bacterium]|nr:urate hydroxylase PuuD [Actinomycetota bacterium]
MDSLLPYVGDWLHLIVRWLHVTAAIAWIGASFYFIALDQSLRPPARAETAAEGVGGEAWEIHGGGFYRVEKYRIAPRTLPAALQWFKWEAYVTWLSGFALLVLLYYVDPSQYLVDPVHPRFQGWELVVASLAIIAFTWLAYDRLCHALATDPRGLALAIALLIVLIAAVSGYLFSPRGAFIQVGAALGTWMAANVFFVIIPGQKALVRLFIALAPRPDVGPAGLTAADFPAVQQVFAARCVTCHSAHPTRDGFTAAPKGVLFDTREEILANARRAYEQAVVAKAMPLGNATGMTEAERDLIGRWFRSGAPAP